MQPTDKGVDAGHSSLGSQDVVGNHVEPRPSPACRRGFKVVVDGVADRELHLPPVVAPTKFGNELRRLRGIGYTSDRRVADLGE